MPYTFLVFMNSLLMNTCFKSGTLLATEGTLNNKNRYGVGSNVIYNLAGDRNIIDIILYDDIITILINAL